MAHDWGDFDTPVRNADHIEKQAKSAPSVPPPSAGGGSRRRSYKSENRRPVSPNELIARRRDS